jgi:hypothetical protein
MKIITILICLIFSFSTIAAEYEVINANTKLYSDQYRINNGSLKSDSGNISAVAKMEGSQVNVTVNHKDSTFTGDTYIFVSKSPLGVDVLTSSRNIKGSQGGEVNFTPANGDFYVSLYTTISTTNLYLYISSPIVVKKNTEIILSNISPSTLIASNDYQNVYLNGSNFTSNSSVDWENGGDSGTMSSGNGFHYESSTRIRLYMKTTTSGTGTWRFRVNSGGNYSTWKSVTAELITSEYASLLELIAWLSPDEHLTQVLSTSNMTDEIALSRSESISLLDAYLSQAVPSFKIDVAPYVNTFADVPNDDWYLQSLLRLAYYQGNHLETVIAKENSNFRPFDKVSKQEFVSIIIKGLNIPIENGNSYIETFKDYGDNSVWATWSKPYFNTAVKHGFVVGNNGYLQPGMTVTIKEALYILNRVKEKFDGKYLHNHNGFISRESIDLTKFLNKKIGSIYTPEFYEENLPGIKILNVVPSAISANDALISCGVENNVFKLTVSASLADDEKVNDSYWWKSDKGYFRQYGSDTSYKTVCFFPSESVATSYRVTVNGGDNIGYGDSYSLSIDGSLFSYEENDTDEVLFNLIDLNNIENNLRASRVYSLEFSESNVTKGGVSYGLENIDVVLKLPNESTIPVYSGHTVNNKINFSVPLIDGINGQKVSLVITARAGEISRTKTLNVTYLPVFSIHGQILNADKEKAATGITINDSSILLNDDGTFYSEFDFSNDLNELRVDVISDSLTNEFSTVTSMLTFDSPSDYIFLIGQNHDNDNDGISNDLDTDDDNDGMPDTFEDAYGLSSVDANDANLDSDGDGLSNLAEYELGTNPTEQDSDGDGVNDGEDSDPVNTEPNDVDVDGMPNDFENQYGFNPYDAADADLDRDNDGLTNLQEFQQGTDPTNPDTDGDGIKDSEDPEPLTPAYNADLTLGELNFNEPLLRECVYREYDDTTLVSLITEVFCVKSGTIDNLEDLAQFQNLEALGLFTPEVNNLIGLQELTNLKYLYIGWMSGNHFTDQELSLIGKLSDLTDLHIINGRISDLTLLSTFSQLMNLSLDGLQLAEHEWQPLSELSINSLNVSRSTFSDLSLLPATIRDLNIGETYVKDISRLYDLTEITSIDVSYLNIELENWDWLSRYTELVKLSVRGTNFENLGLINSSNIINLDVSDTNIVNWNMLSNLTNLERLHLEHGSFNDLNILNSLNLDALYLSHTDIIDWAPLRYFNTLNWIELNGTNFSDLSLLSGLSSLKLVSIHNTEVNDLSALYSLTLLKTLYIENIPLNDTNQIITLTNMGVTVSGIPSSSEGEAVSIGNLEYSDYKDAMTSPTAGDQLTEGKTFRVTWNTDEITGTEVDIYVLHDNPEDIDIEGGFDISVIKSRNWYKFATNIENNGDIGFDAALLNGNGNAYKILLVSDTGDWTVHHGLFSISENATGPEVFTESGLNGSTMYGAVRDDQSGLYKLIKFYFEDGEFTADSQGDTIVGSYTVLSSGIVKLQESGVTTDYFKLVSDVNAPYMIVCHANSEEATDHCSDEDLVFYSNDKSVIDNLITRLNQKVIPEISTLEFDNYQDVLTSPKHDDVFGIDQTFRVTWNTNGFIGTSVDMFVLHDNPENIDVGESFDLSVVKSRNWYKFATNIENSGDVGFDAALLNGLGNAYKILLVSDAGNWTLNRGTFSIKDGIPQDSDNDGVEDSLDAFPTISAASIDTDLDGQPDNFFETCDVACVSASGLTLDLDDDNDGYSDADELANETDNLSADSIPSDNDSDFISDLLDTDDDNDSVLDTADAFPTNAAASIDTDLDGQPDNFFETCDEACVTASGLTLDLDDDNDGYLDTDELANETNSLLASSMPADNDGDFISDLMDSDDDNDGVLDTEDAFSMNAAASIDTDLDGQPDNFSETCDEACVTASGLTLDLDDDNEGYSDADELANETDSLLASSMPADNDGDFISDILDSDDDNDGVLDTEDAFSMNAAASIDTDLDGQPDNFFETCDEACVTASGLTLDLDDDNDGIIDEDDSAPLDNSVGDVEPPVFSELVDVTFEATGTTTEIEVVVPEVTDNNINFPTVVSDYSDALPLGTHEVTWTATDFAGNIATAIQSVTIVDTTAAKFNELQIQAIDAMGALSDVSGAINNVKAYDLVDGNINAALIGDTLYPSGAHLVPVSATDSSGNITETEVEVHINPLVELSQSRKVEPGATVLLPVTLSGNAAVYPVGVTYTLMKAGSVIETNELTIDEGISGVIFIEIPNDGLNGDIYSVDITSANNALLGFVTSTQLTVDEANLAPTLTIITQQDDNNISVVDTTNGVVTLTAIVNDINANDTHDIVWSSLNDTLVDLNTDGLASTFEFSAEALSTDTYKLTVSVSENNTNELFSVSVDKDIVVDASLAALDENTDSDNDGISDADEGYSDSDNDGISDYLDNDDNPSRLPIDDSTASMQTMNGLSLSLGDVVTTSNGATATNATVNINDITDDAHFTALSSIINFNVSGLTEVGQSVPVVIPLSIGNTITEGSIYRKYSDAKGWFDFVVDSENGVYSALADADGNCPYPLSTQYQEGLTVGDNCIQLLIKDGGDNDADGLANGMIKDPGVLTSEAINQAPVIVVNTDETINEGNVVNFDASATTDAENDTLTYQWVQLTGATVELSGQDTSTLSFTAPQVSHDESLTFELTVNDGRDSSSTEVNVLVLQVNVAPTVSIDSHASSYDEGATVSLTAAGNDADNDALTYEWEQISGATVTLSGASSASVTFTAPTVSSDQSFEFKVTVSDGVDVVYATTIVTVNNVAPVTPPVTPPKESGGGGGSMGWILLVMSFGIIRKRLIKVAA